MFFLFFSPDCELRFIESPWSTPCLIIDNNIYNCHSTRKSKGYWRCHNYSKREIEKRCRARCVIENGKIKALTGGEHNHPPHTEKIAKIILKNSLKPQMGATKSHYFSDMHRVDFGDIMNIEEVEEVTD